ncbi:hypothetical protein VWV82_003235 [Cronobacter malonaticus]|uniref:hypothetical protein n=2 Tax=Enterobacteriaceae TaxID=543 RepID=UPI000518F38D|nr:hypothetical protein [Cronobacter malonaticus]EMD9274621.1 hypothetical protein [Cronobacter malonaticus]KIU60752.1 hypothetical protein CRSA0334_16775 [Cronobacter malonaticus ENBT0334]
MTRQVRVFYWSKDMGKMTFVFEYEDGKEPPVHSGMEYLGGKIVSASFRDELEVQEGDSEDCDPDWQE